MAVQSALPSHVGEKLCVFIKDANEKLCAPTSNCLGAKCRDAATLEVTFEETNGTLAATTATLIVTDAAGVGFKRAMQAIANAMGAPTRIGSYVKIADTSTGEFIHPDITAVSAIA